ncbi:TetR/AcrR family transcriptional regulator [Ascidiaceihabitans sp.]|uniref:TetR/AcrR family transcriptional regulator n=1 Tax=Ascidiaceihabitans sp. TaxID=1872644 RepID=UPI0032970600
MARPREFDIEDALEKAMNVFWERGYEEASMPDLLDGMGLSRGSLYKAFTDKKTLFLKSLENYDQHIVCDAAASLSAPPTSTGPNGWDRIIGLFENVTDAWDAGDRRGCLLCSAAVGPASYDAEIADAVSQGLMKLRHAFAAALGEHGEKYADMLVMQYIGLRVLCRSHVAPNVVHNGVKSLYVLRDL